MKKLILIFSTIGLTTIGQAQDEFKVTINKTVRLDDATVVSVKQVDLKAPPPTDPDFSITDDKWVNNIMDKWDYWDGFFKGHQTTLFIYNNGKNSADSVLVAENTDNNFYFTKVGASWHMKNFTIKATNMSLNHVACGQTSKEVFKILNKKIKKQVGNGQVWLSNKNGSYCFILTFVQDKLVSMQL